MELSFWFSSHTCHPFTRMFSCLLLLAFFLNSRVALSDSEYLIGLGSYDITGPAADVNMMGYANTDQIASGIHFRLKARSFIVAEPGGNRVAFVNLDACMASQLVTIKVLERLKSRYGDLYTEQNVAISGIHTHSGPGGYLQYVVYIITSLGFVRQSFDVIVDGIEKSIIQAHQNLRPGSIYVNKGELDAGINRSPSAYLNNPVSERSQYQYNVDKQMTLLKFVDNKWGPIGAFNWFATHGTSMGRTNSLISGDNKGAAARFMEDWAKQKSLGTQSSSTHVAVPGSQNNQQRIPRRVSNIIPQVDDNSDKLKQLVTSFKASGGMQLSDPKSVGWRGASTLYGPHTLNAYIQEFRKLAAALLAGENLPPGPQPPDLLNKQIGLLPPVIIDSAPAGRHFGDISSDVPANSTFKRGEVVAATFWSACPRNDLFTNGTFALIEFLDSNQNWIPAYDDDDFCLRFKWSRPSKLSAQSQATLEWRIPQDSLPGVYRFRHFGASKSLLGSIGYFTGSSRAFLVA